MAQTVPTRISTIIALHGLLAVIGIPLRMLTPTKADVGMQRRITPVNPDHRGTMNSLSTEVGMCHSAHFPQQRGRKLDVARPHLATETTDRVCDRRHRQPTVLAVLHPHGTHLVPRLSLTRGAQDPQHETQMDLLQLRSERRRQVLTLHRRLAVGLQR